MLCDNQIYQGKYIEPQPGDDRLDTNVKLFKALEMARELEEFYRRWSPMVSAIEGLVLDKINKTDE